MARFRFRLDPVLRVRARREELRQQELAQAIAALAAQQGKAVAAERAVDRELAALRGLMGTTAEVHRLRAKHQDLALARAQAAHERAGVEQLELVADERREALIEAARDRQALDKLRERELSAHAAEEARREAAEMDELALTGATRRLRSAS